MPREDAGSAPRALTTKMNDLVAGKILSEKANAAQARRPGRRPRNATGASPGGLSRDAIVQHVVQLAQKEPFAEITIARLANELGVATSLIHYFLGSRDDILSLMLNYALKEVCDRAPPLTGQWRADAEALLREVQQMQSRWKGITAQIATSSRYRLFQHQLLDGKDYGLVFFDRMGRILQSGGFSGAQAASAHHLLMLFLVSVASAQVFQQEPSAKREYLRGHVGQFPAGDYPGCAFMLDDFAAIDTPTTFEKGLRLLLDGIDAWPRDGAKPARAARARPAKTKTA